MYNPDSFRIEDKQVIRDFVAERPFAQLISSHHAQPVVSHLPLLWSAEGTSEGTLFGHFAKANDHWQHANGQRVLAVFTGPHAYISSSWYETPESVPTWNYTAVHIRGRLEILEDGAEVRDVVEKLVTKMEASTDKPWATKQATPAFIEKLLAMIVGFRVVVEDVEFKLSQNHSAARRTLVVAGLAKLDDENSQAVANLMRSLDQ